MKRFILLPILFLHLFACGQNSNVSNGNVFDGEPFLAINPSNSQHLVIAWMGWVNLIDRFKIKTKTSFDGGNSWSSATELPHTVTGYSSADPSIDFGPNGEVYICYIDFTGTTPPVTGGVYISPSFDGGITWGSPFEVINTNFDGSKWPIDRPWMVIDKSSGPNQGNIYVTTFNLNRTQPSFNPYLSVSLDSGATFSSHYLDTLGWLAGNINPFPMCSPALSSTGIFYGVYPSYVVSQSPFFQSMLVSSTNAGQTLSHQLALVQTAPPNASIYPNAKKGGLLLCDPTDDNHLVYVFLSADHGELDVFMIESSNSGNNWTSPLKLNDDPVGNNRMQDLIWGNFDNDGDLIVSWRDRRNGSDSTFQTDTEIWATFRSHTASNFEPNFQITDQAVAFDSILENSGNDFMCIALQDDTLSATWGDTRNGELNIWFQRMTTNGTVLSSQQISPYLPLKIEVFPNPASSIIQVTATHINQIQVYDWTGKVVRTKKFEGIREKVSFSLETLTPGRYLVQVKTKSGTATQHVLKQ